MARLCMARPVVCAGLAGLLCMGCINGRSTMICITTDSQMDKRTSGQLLADLNRRLPFETTSGGFVSGRTLLGPNQWICPGDRRKTEEVMSAIDNTPGWCFRSIGFVSNKHRASSGLSPGAVLFRD